MEEEKNVKRCSKQARGKIKTARSIIIRAVPFTHAVEEEFQDVRAMSGENGNLAKSET